MDTKVFCQNCYFIASVLTDNKELQANRQIVAVCSFINALWVASIWHDSQYVHVQHGTDAVSKNEFDKAIGLKDCRNMFVSVLKVWYYRPYDKFCFWSKEMHQTKVVEISYFRSAKMLKISLFSSTNIFVRGILQVIEKYWQRLCVKCRYYRTIVRVKKKKKIPWGYTYQ